VFVWIRLILVYQPFTFIIILIATMIVLRFVNRSTLAKHEYYC